MVDLPNKNLNDPITLADWLELTALESSDGNASIGDLVTALQISSDVVKNVPVDADDLISEWEEPDDEEITNDLALQVMLEIEHRENAAKEAYPFVVRGAKVLEVKENWRNFRAYVFCLCLSYFGGQAGGGVDPYKLFEELACAAAKHFIHGQAFPFGLACTSGERPFETAVNELCRRLEEGTRFERRSSVRRQDDRVDIVAWKSFGDRLPSKLVLFGQCAGGENWKDKLTEMKPTAFWENWMLNPRISPLIESFYIPHRVNRDEWEFYARNCGILFDRCRVALWAQKENDLVTTDDRYVDWCLSRFNTLS